jgi:hypothetical protein
VYSDCVNVSSMHLSMMMMMMILILILMMIKSIATDTAPGSPVGCDGHLLRTDLCLLSQRWSAIRPLSQVLSQSMSSFAAVS